MSSSNKINIPREDIHKLLDMPPRKEKSRMDGSWVVESEEEDGSSYEGSLVEKESSPPLRKQGRPRRQRQSSEKSPEPEFRMPRVDVDESMEASWVDERSTRLQRDPRSGGKSGEARRRITQSSMSNGSPEKRTKAKPSPLRAQSRLSLQTLPSPAEGTLQNLLGTTVTYIGAMFKWLLDVLGGALRVLKTPITYILAVWLLFGMGVLVRNLVTNSIYASLSPICRIPGTSYLDLPFCPVHKVDTKNGAPPPVEFDELMTVQSKFEEVLEESAGGVSLPMDMKRGEASIRDLRQLVRYSQLQARNELVLEFDGFIETARIASYDLQKFNSHVGRAVDNVVSTTRWTARVLDGIQERDASRGSINAFINDKILAPFQPIKFSESILLDQYIQHTRIIEDEITKLITEAQALLLVLNNLDDRLDVIHGIATRENGHTKALKEEVLSELWTMVGGNRGKITKMDRQLKLLTQVGVYRKVAFAHVSGTILRLQAIGAGLEDLRERVGSPELLRDRVDIPLSVHIENIQRGVERLEAGRQNARKLENDHIKQTLERSQLEGTLIDK